jgi:uncharacterized repeat protein (TIGR03843 family)
VTLPLQALADGELRVLGRLAQASNLALLAEVATDGGKLRCIYKPVSGERPLWDFPGAALAAREVLTAQVADCFGWDLVPSTTWREDGPFGAGMCQAWVEAVDDDPVALFPSGQVPTGWREVAEGRGADGAAIVLAHEPSPALQRLVLLDALVNNADRKGGHILRRADGSVAGIDHGVTFHAEDKLRTVLWGWAGEPIPEVMLGEVRAGAHDFRELVGQWGSDTPHRAAHLSADEVDAALVRLDTLLHVGAFPMPGADWPSLPWPPM